MMNRINKIRESGFNADLLPPSCRSCSTLVQTSLSAFSRTRGALCVQRLYLG